MLLLPLAWLLFTAEIRSRSEKQTGMSTSTKLQLFTTSLQHIQHSIRPVRESETDKLVDNTTQWCVQSCEAYSCIFAARKRPSRQFRRGHSHSSIHIQRVIFIIFAARTHLRPGSHLRINVGDQAKSRQKKKKTKKRAIPKVCDTDPTWKEEILMSCSSRCRLWDISALAR